MNFFKTSASLTYSPLKIQATYIQSSQDHVHEIVYFPSNFPFRGFLTELSGRCASILTTVSCTIYEVFTEYVHMKLSSRPALEDFVGVV